MDGTRRRQSLGRYASAALPTLWKVLARKRWSHSDFARHVGVSNGGAAKILYGDVRAGRRVAGLCATDLGVKLPLWDKACPPNWKPHSYRSLRPKRESELARTGTDG
jgi:hypothetical protein